MHKMFLIMIALVTGTAAGGEESSPVVSAGRLERMSNFPSRFVDARNIDVWLPDGYDRAKRYRVLYMHDGQALFSGQWSVSHQSWRVADTVATMIQQRKLDDIIVVGIWNNGKSRFSEDFPQKVLEYLPKAARTAFVDNVLSGRPRADQYLRFIVEELKPAIDRKFATRPGRDDTVIMGSSMGAIISLYAITEYPQVFGGRRLPFPRIGWADSTTMRVFLSPPSFIFGTAYRIPQPTGSTWITVPSGSMLSTPYINNSSTL